MGFDRQCPCGSGAGLASCCGPVLRGDRPAPTAEEVMRSRYTGYATGDVDHLFRSWHPRTRPAEIRLDPQVAWTGLRVLEVVDGGPGQEAGIVEFEASWTDGTGRHVLRERSSFVRRGGRWVYVEPV